MKKILSLLVFILPLSLMAQDYLNRPGYYLPKDTNSVFLRTTNYSSLVACWPFYQDDSPFGANTGLTYNGSNYAIDVSKSRGNLIATPRNPPWTNFDGGCVLFDTVWPDTQLLTNGASIVPARLTVSAWAYMTTKAVSTYQCILNQGVSGDAASPFTTYALGCTEDNNTMRFLVSAGAVQVTADAPGTFPLNTWVFVCGTWDGSTIYLYTNAVRCATNTFAGPLGATTRTITIGRWYIGDYNYWWRGMIDSVCIYSNALSSPEITNLYQQGRW